MSKHNDNKPTQQSKVIRILALVLAGLMVLGAATVVISILASLGGDHAGHIH